MIKLLLLAVVPFMTQHRNVVPKTEVSTNFYGSVTGIVNNAYIQSHGGGGCVGGIDTNAVIDIANSTIATNPVVAAKIDGPTVAPTNRAGYAGKAADARLTGIALTNRYTKAETDAKLAGKLNGPNDLGIVEAGAELDALILVGRDEVTTYGDVVVMNSDDTPIHSLSIKANRAEPSVAVINELATLDDDGNPTRSGIAADDVITKAGGTFEGDVDFQSYNVQGGFFESAYKIQVLGNADDIPDAHFDDTDIEVYNGDVIADGHSLKNKADISMISETDPTFSSAVMSVATGISTNDWAVIASVADWASVIPGGVPTGAGTLGAVLAALAATVLALKKKTSLLKSDGTAEDGFATDLLGKQVAIQKIDERLPIPISQKNASFRTESYKRFIMNVVDDMTLTLHTPMSNDAEIFECRFDGSGLTADKSISFSTSSGATATTMDANCGTVTAGKVALMSAFWNGSTWDVNWKVEG